MDDNPDDKPFKMLLPELSEDGQVPPPKITSLNHHSILLTWNGEKKDSQEAISPSSEDSTEIYDQMDEENLEQLRSNISKSKEDPSFSDNRTIYYVQTLIGPDQWENVYSGYGTCFLIEKLEPEKEYKYRLRVEDRAQGLSNWSEAATVITSREKFYSDKLHKAIYRNDLDLATKILDSGEVRLDALNEHGLTPLMHASMKGNRRLLRMLLQKGCNTNIQNEIGRTSLMQASFAGHLDCVRLLVDKGANWNLQDKTGQTALHLSVDNGREDIVEFATTTGADVNLAIYNSGWTPLFRAAAVSGNKEIVKILVRAGADVNVRDNDGKTVLMTAVVNNYLGLVQELLHHGADLSLKNNFGRTAYQMAIALDRKEIIKFLEKQTTGSKTHVPL